MRLKIYIKSALENINGQQFIKYLLAGGLYFWSGLAIFAIGYSIFHLWWLWAKIIADIVGWIINYYAQRYWAFAKSKQLKEVQHIWRYTVIELIGFLLDYSIIAILKYFGVSPYIGIFVSAGFFTFWNYFWYKYWVFPDK